MAGSLGGIGQERDDVVAPGDAAVDRDEPGGEGPEREPVAGRQHAEREQQVGADLVAEGEPAGGDLEPPLGLLFWLFAQVEVKGDGGHFDAEGAEEGLAEAVVVGKEPVAERELGEEVGSAGIEVLRHELAGPAITRLEDLEVEQDGDERVGLVERAMHGCDHELTGSEAGVSLKAAGEEVAEGGQRACAQRLEGGEVGGGEPAVNDGVECHPHVVRDHDPLTVRGNHGVHEAEREQQPLDGSGALRGALCEGARLIAEAAVRDGMGRLGGPEEQRLPRGGELLKERFEVVCVVEPLDDAEDKRERVVFVCRLRLDLMEGGEFCQGLVIHPRQEHGSIGPM